MKILVLGGTGWLGPHIVRRLSAVGHEVRVFHRGRTRAALPASVGSIHGDRHDLAAHVAEFARFSPSVVIDVVPYTGWDAALLMRTFDGIARRVVALSSGDVYRNYAGLRRMSEAPPDPTPLSENAPLRDNPHPYRAEATGPEDWRYSYDKIPVERIVLWHANLAGTVLRLPMVYGPGDAQHRLRPYLALMQQGKATIQIAAEQAGWRCTRGDVENVAAAVAHASMDERAAGRVFNIGEHDALTEKGWIEAIGAAFGWKGKVEPVGRENLPADRAPDYDWRYHMELDASRVTAELGFTELMSRDEALRRTIEWELGHPS